VGGETGGFGCIEIETMIRLYVCVQRRKAVVVDCVMHAMRVVGNEGEVRERAPDSAGGEYSVYIIMTGK